MYANKRQSHGDDLVVLSWRHPRDEQMKVNHKNPKAVAPQNGSVRNTVYYRRR
jgi:hypothetical protein